MKRLRRLGWKRLLLYGIVGAVGLFALAQAVPYGRAHKNPPVQVEPRWNSATTRELARRACFDCHSNLSIWPWYSNIAPVSWLVQGDVDSGRSTLDFSEWNRPQDGAGDLADAVLGGMPPWYYKLMHGAADLSAAEKKALGRGLAATIARDPPGP